MCYVESDAYEKQTYSAPEDFTAFFQFACNNPGGCD
jgi:hypothetical protein